MSFLENYQQKGELLKVYTYPHPVLSKKSLPVTNFDERLKKLAQDMLYTMYKAPGIGLAAPQIGENIRMFVIDVEFERKKISRPRIDNPELIEVSYHLSNFHPRVFINPKITRGPELVKCKEGCLSLPGVYEEVERAATVTVEYHDLDGNLCELSAEELLAICIQHENDHLDGVVIIDHLSFLKKNFHKKKLIKRQKLTAAQNGRYLDGNNECNDDDEDDEDENENAAAEGGGNERKI
ncbi:MAG: peptide deformylase [Oligoflexia bacterium]|nr:peptide deformylase [Oligoflexia bacterium]MBF0365553.1 peptide deformylase [Oligoflexia bacterium]